jgi:pimeloyl-ACP methyl ester carboxylesterase
MAIFETDDGCLIHYRVFGNEGRRALVFLNATAQTTWNWIPIARRLAERFRIVLVDSRGQGLSGEGKRALTLETHAADLNALAWHLGLRRAGLVGFSHGARVALAAAGSAWIDRLALFGIGFSVAPRAREIHRAWDRILATGGLEALAWAMIPWVFGEGFLRAHRTVVPNIVDAIVRRNDARRLSLLLEGQTRYPPVSESAKDVGLPVLVVSGSEDLLAPPPSAAVLAEKMKGQHRTVAGAGHSVPAEAPERFVELVHGFFAE